MSEKAEKAAAKAAAKADRERCIHDSTKTRVAPVFDALLASDATGAKWLPQLLSLPRGGRPLAEALGGEADALGALEEAHWDARAARKRREKKLGPGRERRLDAPLSLLSWLVRHLGEVDLPPIAGDDAKARRRAALQAGDPATIARALAKLREGPRPRAWYVLEGRSAPDVFLATPEAVIVVEGKRTEAGPTTGTRWLPGRHQMLRHLDAAYEVAGRRAVLGFFLVEGGESGEPPPAWLDAARATLAPETLAASLPHRPEPEREAIARGFLGVATWQELADRCGLDPAEVLPERT